MIRLTKFEFHHNLVSLTHFTTKNRPNSFFCTGPHQLYESFKFVSYTFKWVYWPPLILLQLGNFSPAVSREFSRLFSKCFLVSIPPTIYIYIYMCGRWYDSPSLNFITIWSLWPTLQPKIGQIPFSAQGLTNYMNPSNLSVTLLSESIGPHWFCCSWAIFRPLSPESFPDFFLNVF